MSVLNPEGIQMDVGSLFGRQDEAGIHPSYPFIVSDTFIEGSRFKAGRKKFKSSQPAALIMDIESRSIPGAVQVGAIADADELPGGVSKFLAADQGADPNAIQEATCFEKELL
jgi:hypothetical protein